MEPERRRGRRLLRRRGAQVGRNRGRARDRHGPDRDPDRRDREARDRGRLLARDARRLPPTRRRRPASPSWSTCGWATCGTRRSTSRCRSSSARSARTCTWPTTATASEALAAARDALVPGGRLIFDVFAPGDDDIAATHGRWLEREPDIYERADWDTDTRTLTLSVKGPEGAATMALSWISRGEWHRPAPGGRLRGRGVLRLVRPHARTAAART